ncbi:MAG: ATP-binding protein [Verrucomicrobiota bacterium]
MIEVKPELPTAELRSADKLSRLLALSILDDVYVPTARDITSAVVVLRMLVKGYELRPPNTNYWLQHNATCSKFVQSTRKVQRGIGVGQSAAIIGVSGTGKSSSVENFLGSVPQVIEHDQSKNALLPRAQIVWIKVVCPVNRRPRAFISQFLSEVDRLAGTAYGESNRRATDEELLNLLARAIRVHAVGLLVIDEIQNVVGRSTKTDRQLMKLFVNMTGTLRVPLLFIGTPKSQDVLDAELADARRMLGTRWTPFKREDMDWDKIITSLWEYQYTKVWSALTPEIKQTIFDLTQGIPALAKTLYSFAQQKVILNSPKGQPELITANILRETADEDMISVAGAVHALRTGAGLDVYDDLLPKILPSPAANLGSSPDLISTAQQSFNDTFLKTTKNLARHEASIKFSAERAPSSATSRR